MQTLVIVYAKAGVLRDRPATTWYGSLADSLVELDPTIELRRDDRCASPAHPVDYVLLFVSAPAADSGEVITSAGVSAGIDMALHLVARLDSPERAEAVRQYMQYETPLYA